MSDVTRKRERASAAGGRGGLARGTSRRASARRETTSGDFSAGVRAPRQARGQESLERLLAAATRLVNERGLEAVTVGDIVREGRSSVGVFYARFEDKDAVLRCLHERFCAHGLAAADVVLAPERWQGRGAAEIVRAVIDGLARLDAEHGGLVRAFVLASGRDPSYAERAVALGRRLSRRLRSLLLARRSELRMADPERAIDFAVWLLLAHHDQRAVFGDVQTSELAWSGEARRVALTRAVLAQLGIEDTADTTERAERTSTAATRTNTRAAKRRARISRVKERRR
jgi:AcrR family transcriptional regulator